MDLSQIVVKIPSFIPIADQTKYEEFILELLGTPVSKRTIYIIAPGAASMHTYGLHKQI